MDVVSWLLSKSYVDKTVIGMGAIKGAPATISSIVDNLDGTHDITFAWKDTNNVTHTSVLTVKDGETPAFSSVAITGGHRLTFTTQDPAQSVAFNVMDGAKGDMGISVVASNVDDNNNLTLTLSNGNVINAGKIKAVTTVDSTLSTTSSNPVENKVITNALNNKVDKEMGKGLFSDEEKAKLANIEDGAQVNVLEKLIINGQEATITDKSIALTLITSAVSNLQNYYLKTETYTKQEVEDLIGSTVGVTIEIVEQLPAEGQSNVIYFLPTETEGVYSQYIYTTDGWILIGSTTVDLSNYYTKAQVDTLLNGKQNVMTIDSFPTPLSNNPVASGGVYTAIAQMQPQFQFANMPTASSTNLGFVYQYTGATGTYTQNMFYRCIYDDTLGEYRWEEVIFHATVTVDSAISGTSTNPVQNKVIKEALDTKQDIMQYSTMPSAQDNLGKIVQYIGTNTANYTNGYFYKAIYDSESDVYLWTVIKFSADMLVDNALSTTSENPVQNKVITAKINSIDAVIPSEASDTNQLVDRDSLGTASQKDFTPYVSPDNTDVPISSSVYSAITSAVYGAYHPSGSKTIAELTSDLLVLANIGNVYKITEDGVTTNLFIGGAGQTIHTGDNAVVVYGGQPNTFLFDLQSGSIDLTPYQTKALESAIEGATTVEGALGVLSTNKVSKVSNATNGNLASLDANGNLVDSGARGIGVVAARRVIGSTSTDMNTLIDAGVYDYNSASAMVNAPTGASAGQLIVFKCVYINQFYRDNADGDLYTRVCYDSTGTQWGDWYKFARIDDIKPILPNTISLNNTPTNMWAVFSLSQIGQTFIASTYCGGYNSTLIIDRFNSYIVRSDNTNSQPQLQVEELTYNSDGTKFAIKIPYGTSGIKPRISFVATGGNDALARPIYVGSMTEADMLTELGLTSYTNYLQKLVTDSDISTKQPKTLDTPITVDGVQKTTVETALSALVSKKMYYSIVTANDPTAIETNFKTLMPQGVNLVFWQKGGSHELLIVQNTDADYYSYVWFSYGQPIYQRIHTPAGWSTVFNGKDTYSTNETLTNKVWIDGKPIYRKVIHHAGVVASGSGTLIGNVTGFADVITFEGTFRNNVDGNCFPIGYTYSNFGSTVVQNMPFTMGNNGNIYANPYGFDISNINVVVEYTKTTD